MPLYIALSGVTDSQNLKERATQLFIKCESEALVTQKFVLN